MIRLLKYKIIAIIGLLLILVSCSDGEERVRTLKVETDKVTVTHEKQTKTVAVEVDKGEKFVASWSGESWARVEIVDGGVDIILAANTTIKDRIGSVEIRLESGWRTTLIEVSQRGAKPIFSVVPDEIFVDFIGGERTITVQSEDQWSIQSNATWLEAKPYASSGDIVITIGENTSWNTRQANITISVAGERKEVLVEQGAAFGSLLPYLDFNDPSVEKLMEYELARYSSFIPGMGVAIAHRVNTKSALCPLILYALMDPVPPYLLEANYMYSAVMYDKVAYPDFFAKEQYREFLTSNGFEFLYLGSDGKSYFWLDFGEEITYHCEASVNSLSGLITYARKKQEDKPVTEDFPTFAAFPYMPTEIAFESDQSVAKAWEATNGGTLFADQGNLIGYMVEAGTDFHARLYTYKSQTPTPRSSLYRVDYVFLEKRQMFLPLGSGHIINPRFEKMLADEGFMLIGSDEMGSPIYKHVAKGIEILAGLIMVGDDPTIYGNIAFTKHIPKSGVGGRAMFNDYKSSSPKLTPVKVNLLNKETVQR